MSERLEMPSDQMPRYLHYPEMKADIEAYAELATVEVEVTDKRIHFNDGKQWADPGDVKVKLSPADAGLLERRGQINIVSKK